MNFLSLYLNLYGYTIVLAFIALTICILNIYRDIIASAAVSDVLCDFNLCEWMESKWMKSWRVGVSVGLVRTWAIFWLFLEISKILENLEQL